jgi:hypothetical protein
LAWSKPPYTKAASQLAIKLCLWLVSVKVSLPADEGEAFI